MIRKAGIVLTSAGLLLLVWLAVTIWWGDPVTSLYTRYEQRGLATRLDTVERNWLATSRSSAAVAVDRTSKTVAARSAAARVAAQAIAFRSSLHDGDPIGRIVVPRLHLKMVVVQGTTESDLEKGPGHYDAASGRTTGLPGMGGVIGIAGHRTTYLHPFRHIDDLRSGDRIYLEMPYGTFRYTVYFHKVVLSTDWSILRQRPFEKLVLSACHPLYSATHRWVVFARLSGSSRSAAA
jgi:sortase A